MTTMAASQGLVRRKLSGIPVRQASGSASRTRNGQKISSPRTDDIQLARSACPNPRCIEKVGVFEWATEKYGASGAPYIP